MLCVKPVEAQTLTENPGVYSIERYDENWSGLAGSDAPKDWLDDLHYIPLSPNNPDFYLTVGGELRVKYDVFHHEGQGLLGKSHDIYAPVRELVDADLHLGSQVRFFLQLGRYEVVGKPYPASSSNANDGRIQQAFVDLTSSFKWGDLTIRIGRQEIYLGSQLFVYVNDGSNIRTTFDGVRLHGRLWSKISLDGFVLRPVTPVRHSFEDHSDERSIFAGVYASEALLPGRALHLDEYFYDLQTPILASAGVARNNLRDTVGLRLWGGVGHFDYDGEVVYQFGRSADRSVRAGGSVVRAGYRLAGVQWRPRIELLGAFFTGDHNRSSGSTNTFDPLYPKSSVLNDPGLDTFANLIEAYPNLTLNFTPDLALRLGPQFLWKESAHDAVYVAPFTPLSRTLHNTQTYIGTNYLVGLNWLATNNLSLSASFVHQVAGRAITAAGGRGSEVWQLSAKLSF